MCSSGGHNGGLPAFGELWTLAMSDPSARAATRVYEHIFDHAPGIGVVSISTAERGVFGDQRRHAPASGACFHLATRQ